MYYVLFVVVWNAVLLFLFDLEALNTYDSMSLQDDHKNYTNIIGAARFEKTDFHEMKEWVMTKSCKLPRARSKLVKFLGAWYFKRMSADEFGEIEEWYFQERAGVHSPQALATLMERE